MRLFGSIWIGKLLGAFFGYLIAHAPGALIGLLIGNLFDRALAAYFSRPPWQFQIKKEPHLQNIFLEATFSVLGYLAKADGRVSKAEIDMANVLMTEIHLDKKQKTQAREFFNKGKDPAFYLKSLLSQLRSACYNHRDVLHAFIEMQYRMAQVDGLDGNKLSAFNAMLSHLGFAPLHLQNRFYHAFDFTNSSKQKSYTTSPPRQNDPLQEAHAILGTQPDSSKEVVKKSYRQLISQHHPDKLIAKGASDAAIRVANDKTQAIRKAYERICESKGWY